LEAIVFSHGLGGEPTFAEAMMNGEVAPISP
jgi:hypothetical protein